jgi:hypothetical protein
MEYIRSFVHNDPHTRRWRADDNEIIISSLSERAEGISDTRFTLLLIVAHVIAQVQMGILSTGHPAPVCHRVTARP